VDTITLPTMEQEQRAKWDLLLADIELRQDQLRLTRYQARWETARAWAMMALASAALLGAGVALGKLVLFHQ
jgi:hypothetical protein